MVRDSLAEHGRGSARNRVLGILGGILRELKPHSLCGRTLLSAAFAFAFEVDFAFLGYCSCLYLLLYSYAKKPESKTADKSAGPTQPGSSLAGVRHSCLPDRTWPRAAVRLRVAEGPVPDQSNRPRVHCRRSTSARPYGPGVARRADRREIVPAADGKNRGAKLTTVMWQALS
jgi:hypothetical protein